VRSIPAGINSKQSQITKFEMFETKEFENFGFWKFEFVSNFDIRISNFFKPDNYSGSEN